MRSESVKSLRRSAASALWGMTNFFQMLQHRRILNRACQSGFSVPLARLAMRLYRAPKRLSLGRAVAPTAIAPNRGIAPWCRWATTLVKVCLGNFDRTIPRHPTNEYDIHIDDIMISAERDADDQVALALLGAADHMRQVVIHAIGAGLAQPKAQTVGSSLI